jgi:hypothetical protein
MTTVSLAGTELNLVYSQWHRCFPLGSRFSYGETCISSLVAFPGMASSRVRMLRMLRGCVCMQCTRIGWRKKLNRFWMKTLYTLASLVSHFWSTSRNLQFGIFFFSSQATMEYIPHSKNIWTNKAAYFLLKVIQVCLYSQSRKKLLLTKLGINSELAKYEQTVWALLCLLNMCPNSSFWHPSVSLQSHSHTCITRIASWRAESRAEAIQKRRFYLRANRIARRG